MTDPISEALSDPAQRRQRTLTRLQEDADALVLAQAEDPSNVDYLATASALLLSVRGLLIDAGGNPLSGPDAVTLATALGVIEAGRNAYRILANQGGASCLGVACYAKIASTLNDAYCVLNRVEIESSAQVLDVSDALGASNCSSTIGGNPSSPLAGSNAFELLFSANANGVSVSSNAASHVAAWRADILSFPAGMTDSANRALSAIAGGVVVPS